MYRGSRGRRYYSVRARPHRHEMASTWRLITNYCHETYHANQDSQQNQILPVDVDSDPLEIIRQFDTLASANPTQHEVHEWRNPFFHLPLVVADDVNRDLAGNENRISNTVTAAYGSRIGNMRTFMQIRKTSGQIEEVPYYSGMVACSFQDAFNPVYPLYLGLKAPPIDRDSIEGNQGRLDRESNPADYPTSIQPGIEWESYGNSSRATGQFLDVELGYWENTGYLRDSHVISWPAGMAERVLEVPNIMHWLKRWHRSSLVDTTPHTLNKYVRIPPKCRRMNENSYLGMVLHFPREHYPTLRRITLYDSVDTSGYARMDMLVTDSNRIIWGYAWDNGSVPTSAVSSGSGVFVYGDLVLDGSAPNNAEDYGHHAANLNAGNVTTLLTRYMDHLLPRYRTEVSITLKHSFDEYPIVS